MSTAGAGAAAGAGTGALRVRVGWAVVLQVIAALEFTAAYDGVAAPVALVMSVLVPFGLVWAGVALRIGSVRFGSSWPALVTVVLTAGGAWLVLRGSVSDALPRLLTTARPAPSSAALLAPSVVLVVLVSAVVAACVLAGDDAPGTDRRVAGLLAPVVGAALVYTGAQLLSAGSADPDGVVAACLLVVVVAGWSTPYLRRGGVSWRPAAVLPVVFGVLVAVGLASLVPAGAFDPRRHVSPPTVRLTASSPLTQLEVWAANPSVEIFQARVTGTAQLHLATLSTFTGSAWQVDDRYREVGLDGRPDLPDGSRTTPVTATVKISQLGSIWLPSAGTATSTTLAGALVDSDDGTLAVAGGVRPGEQYDIHAAVATPTDAQLSAASVPVDPPSRYLALPGAPIAFAQYARAAVRGASTPLEEAVAIEHAVSTNRSVSATSPTGSSYARLQSFLFSPKGPAGAQTGTSEQFAAAFAVLGREVGLPTRLVVGFDIPAAGGSGAATSVVHGSNATVFPEVYFTGAGWIPFAPTPGTTGDAGDANLRDNVLQRVSDHAGNLTTVPPPITAGKATAPGRGRSTTRAGAISTHDAGLSTGVIVVIVLGAVVLLLLVGLVALRSLRVARHRRLGARGAWAEFLDLLVLLGRRPPPSAAAPELAAAFDTVYGPPGVRAARLAEAADHAAFAPVVPSVPSGPSAGSGGEVPGLWRDLRVLQRRARRTVPRYRRVLWPVDPRPLLSRRR